MASYKLNEEKMFADIADNVAIIINSETGIYYGMNAFGTMLFENVIKGADTAVILDQLKKIPDIAPDIEIRFDAFINALIEKDLIIVSDASDASDEVAVNIDAQLASGDDFVLSFSEYNDAQELLLADPIHEVKEETGWLPEVAALNTDLEDVARREAKMME